MDNMGDFRMPSGAEVDIIPEGTSYLEQALERLRKEGSLLSGDALYVVQDFGF